MRSILIGLLLAIVINLGVFFAAAQYPEKADAVAAAVCDSAAGDWFCKEAADDKQAIVGVASNLVSIDVKVDPNKTFRCDLSGCCSGYGGPQYLDLDTGKVICRSENMSPQCTCDRLPKEVAE